MSLGIMTNKKIKGSGLRGGSYPGPRREPYKILTCSIGESIVEQVKQGANERGLKVSRYVESILKTHLLKS